MRNIIICLASAMTMLISGCDLNETTMVTTATTAGNITMLTWWFSVQDPDASVKAVLTEVVTKVTTATVKVSEGETYFDAVLPQVQEIVLRQTKLNDDQKNLINVGSVTILIVIDRLLASNEKVKSNANLVTKIVAAFGKGCLSVLNMGEDAPEIQRARGVYTRPPRVVDGKFVTK